MRSVIDAILDTSVLLAFAQGERHQVDEDTLLSRAAVSAVSVAEFRSKLLEKTVPAEEVEATLRDFNLKVLPFGAAEADAAGRLIPLARPHGIGLGDCACIATGLVAGLTVWTADRDWIKLDVAAAIKLIR
ncbi:type II toxin-antitoxin system VapC family toxin [Novosphingobium sp. HII-3]|uniref:type II toxin-antitoxin system VapC family toxin n=1 Tax=Novosphingobium sp. HII-3 TaxID=2075565 RepID=UPI001E34C995|nr:type II toxin-antitoxin system VapC family toxin [Novosphingobium sp. HII-3]